MKKKIQIIAGGFSREREISLKTAIYWTKHMTNIRLVYRDNIKSICSQISNVKF